MIKELVQQNLQRAKEAATIIARKGAEEYKKHPELYTEIATELVGNLLLHRLGIKMADKFHPDLMTTLRSHSDRRLAFTSLSVPQAGLVLTERNLLVGTSFVVLRKAMLSLNTEVARRKGYQKGKEDAAKEAISPSLTDLINRLSGLTPNLPPIKPR